MAEFRTLKMTFWSDPFIEGLPSMVRYLYLYLITCQHTSNLGIIDVTRRRIAYETGLTEEQIEDGIRVLSESGKVIVNGDGMLLTTFIKNQTAVSPNMTLNLKKLLSCVDSKPFKEAIYRLYPFLRDKDTVSRGIDTPSRGSHTPSSNEVELNRTEDELNRTETNPYVGQNPPDALEGGVDSTKNDEVAPESAKIPHVPHTKIMDLWNSIVAPKGKPSIKSMTDFRKKALKRMWRDLGEGNDFTDPDVWWQFFEFCTRSEVLMAGGWFTFDWLFKPANFQKIFEGNYHGRRAQAWQERR